MTPPEARCSTGKPLFAVGNGVYHRLVDFRARTRRSIAARFAPLLAVVALLSAIARPVLACEMGRAEHHPASHASVDHAAAHSPAHTPAHTPDHTTPHTPRPPACDHLVGCAVMVVATTPSIVLGPVDAPSAAPREIVSVNDSPVLAVEPPPPRR